MTNNKEVYKNLPATDKLLCLPEIIRLIEKYGKELVLFSIRSTIGFFRTSIHSGNQPPSDKEILLKINWLLQRCTEHNLKSVINTTGVIIHTNLGRSPFASSYIDDAAKVLKGYNNLEFNLENGNRGNRNDHVAEILKYLTGAEEILVVNNNAAAVMMILRAFAQGKEVIVSRGELIEIGGSFRIPEIMAASDCKMVEVGTTNKTKLDDYKNAITKKTRIIFKAHKSNYVIKGFTEDVDIKELSALGKKNNIPVLYDLGSGLLRKSKFNLLKNEPDVQKCVESGIDLVCFSGDKLLGGPQAGIIAGKKIYIDILKKEPMLRALRVCKLTLAFLETACLYHLNEQLLYNNNLNFKFFSGKKDELFKTAEKLKDRLDNAGIITEILRSSGQFGGGTLPDIEIDSFAVKIVNNASNKIRSAYAENMYNGLLHHQQPVLAVLKKGDIYFDMLTVLDDDMDQLADIIIEVNNNVNQKVYNK